MQEGNPLGHITTLGPDITANLGAIAILHPPGTFALTPASLIAIQAIVMHQERLQGIGLDWGSGTGCLAIAAARISQVQEVIGLEISQANVYIARENARLNGVQDKLKFLLSDSYLPLSQEDRQLLESLSGRVDFILANPPASVGDDGFGYRREVLAGVGRYLVDGGLVFLNVSRQYGTERVERLTVLYPYFQYGGVLASTDWVPFDLSRPDLLECLEQYAQEERNGGFRYAFAHPEEPLQSMSAQEALAHFRATGQSPLSQWQVHLFIYHPS